MWFGILGPLEVRDADGVLRVSSVRQRTLLAALLGRPGRALSIAALTEAVWNETPPATAAETLRSHVMGLRRILGPSGGPRVQARYPGYLIDVGEHELDASVFTARIRRAAAAERDERWADCARELTAALALWRGMPLSDVPQSAQLEETLLELDELHRQALRMRFSAQLRLGRHLEIIGELMTLLRHDRSQEEFTAQLMLALYRADRQADALAAFARTRDFLAVEYGVDPGPQLQRLHCQILRRETELDLGSTSRDMQVAITGGHRLPRGPCDCRLPVITTQEEQVEQVLVVLVVLPPATSSMSPPW